jgi:hypothetical protein
VDAQPSIGSQRGSIAQLTRTRELGIIRGQSRQTSLLTFSQDTLSALDQFFTCGHVPGYWHRVLITGKQPTLLSVKQKTTDHSKKERKKKERKNNETKEEEKKRLTTQRWTGSCPPPLQLVSSSGCTAT